MKMATKHTLPWPLIIFSFIRGTLSSVGDSSPYYFFCVRECEAAICDSEKDSDDLQKLDFSFSLWSCLENCEYECQWETVEAFQRRNWPIPQFKGKWPFIRLLGFQEPASVFFSIVNFIVIVKLLILFKRKVPKSTPYYYIWTIHAWVQLNSWIWSAVYHTRETDFTEKMDYMSAFLVVLYSCYTMGLRYTSTNFNIKTLFWSLFCGSIGLNHLTYLWLFNFDYGYNMKLNCIVGGVCILGWILWSFLHFQKQPFVWKIFLFSVLFALTTLLELLDFPPILWLVDAHALWHGSNVIVTILLYLFAIDDCCYINDFKVDKTFLTDKKK